MPAATSFPLEGLPLGDALADTLLTAPAMQAGPGAALPHGATFADAKMIRGLMLILMALLLLVCARPFPAAARR